MSRPGLPKAMWFIPVVGSLIVAAGRLLRYMRDIMSANVYETGVTYEYPEDFDEDEYTHFISGEEVEEQRDKAEEGTVEGQQGLKGMLELNILRQFVREKVIPYFKGQRDSANGGDHFSVLILLEEPLSSLSGVWTFRPLTDAGTPHVDSKQRTCPSRNMYGNYVVARPQMHRVNQILRIIMLQKVPEIYYEHAEVLLLNEFETLCKMFGRETKVIILFSLLFPCDRCTSELVQKFGHGFRAERPSVQRVVLVFVLFWHRMPFEENWGNFERLKESGFDIVRLHM
jgi:hypothetical protein